MPPAILLISALVASAPGAVADDAGAVDLKKMQGDWMIVSMVAAGVKVADDEAQALFRTIDGDKYTVSRYSKPVSRGTFKLDATKTPRTIDLTPSAPGDSAKSVLGIYEFEGNRLRLCLAAPGKPRPTDFKSRIDHTLVVWEPETNKQ
jgi:uncharacterized protein (TIGR03067 family)